MTKNHHHPPLLLSSNLNTKALVCSRRVAATKGEIERGSKLIMGDNQKGLHDPSST
ncbi:High-affinity glucose transporter [Sesbania bispinosa]|nr:High-affinity glucose transporter [Sesbania bispinosa]